LRRGKRRNKVHSSREEYILKSGESLGSPSEQTAIATKKQKKGGRTRDSDLPPRRGPSSHQSQCGRAYVSKAKRGRKKNTRLRVIELKVKGRVWCHQMAPPF